MARRPVRAFAGLALLGCGAFGGADEPGPPLGASVPAEAAPSPPPPRDAAPGDAPEDAGADAANAPLRTVDFEEGLLVGGSRGADAVDPATTVFLVTPGLRGGHAMAVDTRSADSTRACT